MKRISVWGLCLVLALMLCLICGLTACDNGSEETPTDAPTETATDAPTDAPTEAPTEEPTEAPTEEPTEAPTEPETEPETEAINLNIQAQDLEDMMQSIFSGNFIQNETVMFLDKGEEKSLLFKADEIISVTSYDERKTYTEGVDYELVDGKIKCLEGGSIPCITAKKYWGADSSSLLQTKNPDGKSVYTYWGEATAMTTWQVKVNYTHSEAWEGFMQPSEVRTLKSFVDKLKNGDDVTIIFYGDSITYGANASFLVGGGTNQLPYTMLFTKALADLFGYNVHFVATNNLSGTARVPGDYETGATPTITYINPSVGGWTSNDGLSKYDTYIKPYIEQYGCDLFMLAFGMNDGGSTAKNVYSTQKRILDKVLAQAPETSLLLMATMVPNPDATNGWYGSQAKQEAALIDGAAKYVENGVPCAVVRMGSTSLAILEHKNFRDYTGNNINHPNDFFSRVYAQTLLQCVIGYENMK